MQHAGLKWALFPCWRNRCSITLDRPAFLVWTRSSGAMLWALSALLLLKRWKAHTSVRLLIMLRAMRFYLLPCVCRKFVGICLLYVYSAECPDGCPRTILGIWWFHVIMYESVFQRTVTHNTPQRPVTRVVFMRNSSDNGCHILLASANFNFSFRFRSARSARRVMDPSDMWVARRVGCVRWQGQNMFMFWCITPDNFKCY